MSLIFWQALTRTLCQVYDYLDGYTLKKAAHRGHPEAQYRLGRLYATGTTTLPQNKRKAYQLFVQAANQGHRRAYHQVALLDAILPLEERSPTFNPCTLRKDEWTLNE